MGDDGLGVHAVKKLEKLDLPPTVKVVDAGTRSLDTLLAFDEAEKVIIIDAVKLGNEPGKIYRLGEEELPSAGLHFLSLHDLGLEYSLKVARQALGASIPKEIIVFGMEVGSIKAGIELSSPVKEALPSLIDRVLREL